MPPTHQFIAPPDVAGTRLDQLLAAQPWAPSRSQIKAAISRGDVTVNDRPGKPGHRVRPGDQICVTLRAAPIPHLIPQPMPLVIVHEDPRLLIVNKPSGLVVHPGAGHPDGTLVNGLLAHCGDALSVFDMDVRPGIVHRLDRDTSGILVVAKDPAAHAHLALQFANRTIERRYLALCHAPGLDDQIRIESLHGRHPNDRKRFTGRVREGKRAVTHARVLERFEDHAALVECKLETGRTHQIRVHLSENHAPLLGDPIYGSRLTRSCRLISRLALHAWTLGFIHPDGHPLRFDALPPPDMMHAIARLRAGGAWR